MAAKQETDLEKNLQELEKIVEKMESGKLNLEESLKLFERGITLTKTCQTVLKNAEQKVQKLSENKTLEDFNTENE